MILYCLAVVLVECLESVCLLNRFSCVQLFASLWTVAHKAPLSMEFFRQEYWSGLPRPPPEDLRDLGIRELSSLMPPALAGGFFTSSATWEALCLGSTYI